MIHFEELYENTVVEKDEHRKSKEYVDDIFNKMDSKPSDFLNTFEKTIKDVSKKFKVPEKKVMDYFEKEMLSI